MSSSELDAGSYLSKKSKGVEGNKMGADQSLGKDDNYFGVGIKM